MDAVRSAGFGIASVIAIALAAAVLAEPVAAAPGYHVVPAGHVTRFQLMGEGGYRIQVSANHRRNVRLEVSRDGVTSAYRIRGGRAERYGIDTKLAGLGAIDVAFTPSGRARRLARDPTCDGPRPVVETGVVRGRIRFQGEGGYTSVAAHRVKAEVLSWPRQRCRVFEAGNFPRPRKRVASFTALSTSASAEFRAAKYSRRFRPAARQVQFAVYFGSQRGRLLIHRSVFATADATSFRRPSLRSQPEHLVLTPPPPFTGTASFERTPESTFSWTGTLAVEVPGLPPLPLTGPDYEASFCVLRACIGQTATGASTVPSRLGGEQ